MDLLIPKLSPIQWCLYGLALICCFVFSDSTSSEILYAIEPVTAGLLLAAGSAASKGIGSLIKGIQARRAQKRIERSPEMRAAKRQARQARRRLRKGDYGLTEAEKARGVGEAKRSFESSIKSAEAGLQRGASSPFGAGRRRALATALTSGAADTAAKARAGMEELSSKVAATERQADQASLQQALATRTALEQGKAAANTAIATGAATTVGELASTGLQAAGAGLFTPLDREAQAKAIAQNIAKQGENVQPLTNPAGTQPPAGADGVQ